MHCYCDVEFYFVPRSGSYIISAVTWDQVVSMTTVAMPIVPGAQLVLLTDGCLAPRTSTSDPRAWYVT